MALTLDIKVTYDATWSRCGFTAIHGVVVVISLDTGQVLNFEVMSPAPHAHSRRQNWERRSLMSGWMDTGNIALPTTRDLHLPWSVLELSFSESVPWKPATSGTLRSSQTVTQRPSPS
jgi:hypothetical protein